MKNSERTMKEKLVKIQEEHKGYNLYTKPLMKDFGAKEITFNFRRKSDKIEWWYLSNYWADITKDVPTKVREKLEEIKKMENFNEFSYSLCCDTTGFFDLTKKSDITKYIGYIQKDFEEFSIRFVLDNTYDREDYNCNVDLVVVKNSAEIWRKHLALDAARATFFEKVSDHFNGTVERINWIKKEIQRLIELDKLDTEFEKLLG